MNRKYFFIFRFFNLFILTFPKHNERKISSRKFHRNKINAWLGYSDFNDVKFKYQWYLHNTGQTGGPAGIDINVLPVWRMNITGRGIVVSIIDDGLEYTNPDLEKNYDSLASYDFQKNIFDSMPDQKDWANAHGTRCAGEVAAEANNNFCGVGVAFNAKIGGIKLLSISMNDTFEAKALSFNNNYIDIYSNSWGPKDDGKSYGKPGPISESAIKKGVTYGRNGKGCIYVWATGNGGLMNDDCNCDGYVSSIYTISIGSISDHGLSVFYKESCSSTLAVTFSGGSHHEREENKIITTDINEKCTENFRGTSSAAPIASGIIALVLEANPNLTWRDVQHLIVHTSSVTSPFDNGWKRNGAGFHFNHKFGFGKLDAFNMIKLAKIWNNVASQKICHGFTTNKEIILQRNSSMDIYIPVDACMSQEENYIDKLEHVILRVSYESPQRGSVSIVLISPSNTSSQILSSRKRDIDETSIEEWDFMTIFNWGESPKGTWIVSIRDTEISEKNRENKKKQGDSNARMDEEDLMKQIMDEYDSNDTNNKRSSLVYSRRIKRENDSKSILNVRFKKFQLIFYGT